MAAKLGSEAISGGGWLVVSCVVTASFSLTKDWLRSGLRVGGGEMSRARVLGATIPNTEAHRAVLIQLDGLLDFTKGWCRDSVEVYVRLACMVKSLV